MAPQARFTEKVRPDISQLGDVDTMIAAFAPEIIGKPLEEESVEEAKSVIRNIALDNSTTSTKSRTVYQYHLDNRPETRSSPRHVLVSMIADGNRLYIFSLKASTLAWRNKRDVFEKVLDSFDVVV